MDTQTLEDDLTYWWLRLHYSLQDRRLDNAAEAQRQLDALGFSVRLRDVKPSAKWESHADD